MWRSGERPRIMSACLGPRCANVATGPDDLCDACRARAENDEREKIADTGKRAKLGSGAAAKHPAWRLRSRQGAE